MVSRIFSAFLMEQLSWAGTGVSCAFTSPFLTGFSWHLAPPGDPITLWVLAAAGLPRLLPHGRAVSVRACHHLQPLQPLAPWHTGDGEGAVEAEGDGKKDSWVRGKEAPAGSVTAACGAPTVSIKGSPSGETVFKEKRSRWFPAKPTHSGLLPG